MSLLLDRFPVLALRFQRKGKAAPKTGLRPDIQGLRAFAVIAVILDHLLGWPKGGYVGVDIFFVISGYVITASLLREHERTGRISFANFYKRRINRIMPAAVLVLIVTLAFSYIAFSATRFMATLWDGVAALLFSANWRFAAVGTDYFQADGPVSPLQHFWSLAVEEQYYFVWPVVMTIVLAIFAKRSAARTATGIAVAIIAAASFAWALFETVSNPNMAYFSTLSRGWELALGAAIAIAAPLFTTIAAKVRPILAWAGIVGMVASLFVVDAAAGFPAPAAALPVLATALVLIAGTGTREHRWLAVLTNPVSRYLGDISYSLYLWHFPIIIIGGVIMEGKPEFYLVAAAATLIISYYSYELLEDPIRRNSLLTTKPKRERGGAPNLPESYKLKVLSLLAVATIVVAGAALARSTAEVPAYAGSPLPAPASSGSVIPSTPAVNYGPAVTGLQQELANALRVTSWPSLQPSMDDAIASDEAPTDLKECGGSSPVDEVTCTFGAASATKTAVIVGDSISVTYANVLRDVVGDNSDWQIKSYGTFGCLFTSVQSTSGSIGSKCADRNAQAVNAINSLKPDVVFISNHYLPRAVDGQPQPMTAADWADSVKAQVAKFLGAAGSVVFLAAPPAEVNIGECYSKVSVPSNCISTVTAQWQSMADAEKALAASVGGRWVDSRQWFCAHGSCPSFAGNIPTKIDRNHMTQEYGHHIAPAVKETLTEQKIL